MRNVLIAAVLCLVPLVALATGKPPATPPPSVSFAGSAQADAEAAAKATSTSGASAITGPSTSSVAGVQGGSGMSQIVDQSSTRMLALPGGAFSAGALPAAWCVESKQTYRKWLFGFYEGYDAGSQTDFECLKLLAELGAMRQTAPPAQPSMHFFLAPAVNSSAVSTEKCEKPAPTPKKNIKKQRKAASTCPAK